LVLDIEHAPFSVEQTDHCILAARSAGLPVLVRVDGLYPNVIQRALDMGAAGVIVPHIQSAEDAHVAIAATRYFGGTRGFSAGHRAANYGRIETANYREWSDASSIIIGQIEDAVAVGRIDEIAAISGLDALFIGRADLAISFGVTEVHNRHVEKAVSSISQSCLSAGRSIGMFLPSISELPSAVSKGASLFFVGSDQSLLKASAKGLVGEFKQCRF
jgi:2-keto-3-deoxy-L-rhamnonate aldolase RhmA